MEKISEGNKQKLTKFNLLNTGFPHIQILLSLDDLIKILGFQN